MTLERILRKKNFSQPDKSHLHHHVLKYFLNDQFKTFLSINILNIIIIFFGYFVCLYIGKIYSLFLFILLFFIFAVIRFKFIKN